MMESMSLLSLELNEQRRREVALDTMRDIRGAERIVESKPGDEHWWPSPTAPRLVVAKSTDCVEAQLPRAA